MSTLDAVAACLEAQRAYFRQDPDGDGVLEYAQKFKSSPGRHDGLYWKGETREPPSPIAAIVDLINGLIRFPVMLTYCLFGLLLAMLLDQDATFLSRVSSLDRPDYLVPVFIITYLPVGFRGLVMSGIFAAAMSSIDFALNSLSTITMEDFLAGSSWAGRAAPARKRLLASRLITLSWGLFCLMSGLMLVRSSRTIIELVNMVGSTFYGPVLAVFCCGILIKRVRGGQMLLGLVGGTALNLFLWKGAPHISWLWWNPAGFLRAIAFAWGRP